MTAPVSAPAQRFTVTRDPEEFARRAEGFLGERIERNVMATVLMHARSGFASGGPPLFAYAAAATGPIAAAALRVPPFPLLSSDLDPDGADDLLAAWIAHDPAPGAVSATPSTARAVAAAWARLTGGSARIRMREAMHALTAVEDPPWPADGHLRPARESEREVLVAWMRAFAAEANVAGGDTGAIVDRGIARGALFVWEDGGEPVSLVSRSPRVAGVVRLGPVYTPPEHRRHGYAGSAVAATSRRALAEGAERCMLFTDLANPTSNKIYAEVGYARIGDWEEHALEAAR